MHRRLLSCLLILLACTSIAFAQTAKTPRKASPTLASLPAPKAGGAPRILLVVDDWGKSKGSPIYRKLVADAVGGEAKAWSSIVVKPNEHGPAADKLRDFNVVVWYTGDSYGGGANGVSTLSDEDEKTVRRYLQETGGAFILVSPGFLSTRSYGTTWTESATPNPFLKEVVGVTGFADLVQRFTAGAVSTPGGASFAVQAKGSVETQFTAVNPDGAAVVFSAALDPAKTAKTPVPVAVANAYGGGRFVYVGFSLENMADGERAKAFGVVLGAATGPGTAVAAPPPVPTRTPVAQKSTGGTQTLKPPPAGPPATNLHVAGTAAANHSLTWEYGGNRPASYEVFRRDPDGWKHLGTKPTASGKGANVDSYNDLSFVAPNSAYRVVTVHADGRRGSAEVEYPNPPQPERPTGLVSSQVRWDGIQLKWDRKNAVRRYRVYGPGLPADGYRMVDDTGWENRVWGPWTNSATGQVISGAPTVTTRTLIFEAYQLAPGTHEYRVAHDYTHLSNAADLQNVQWPERVSPLTVAVQVTVTPQQPPVPTDLRVEQLGYRRIVVRWKPASNPGTGRVHISAAGMPGGSQPAIPRAGIDQWMEFREVPEGTHTIQVRYGFNGGSAPAAQLTTTVVPMAMTSNDISSCTGTWVSEACRRDSTGAAMKARDKVGGKFGK